MTRSENKELRQKLRTVLWRSLCEKGLDATSYQSIADDAGISRALVQHYYPRKMDFAADFLEGALLTAATVLKVEAYVRDEGLSPYDSHRMGCLYYGFLLDEHGARGFLFDILKNRAFADELMRQHYSWALKNLDPTLPSYEDRTEGAIMAWGGFYELMYASIKLGTPFDVPSKALFILRAFLEQKGEIGTVLDEAAEYRPDPELLRKLSELMRAQAGIS